MKLKEWLKKVNSLKQENDFISISMRDGYWYEPPSYKVRHKLSKHITFDDIKQYPLLLECDIYDEKIYDSEYILASFTSLNCGGGKCKQYSCWIYEDQGKIAFKHKGKFSL